MFCSKVSQLNARILQNVNLVHRSCVREPAEQGFDSQGLKYFPRFHRELLSARSDAAIVSRSADSMLLYVYSDLTALCCERGPVCT